MSKDLSTDCGYCRRRQSTGHIRWCKRHSPRMTMTSQVLYSVAEVNRQRLEAQIELLDRIIDIESEKLFLHWKPTDIANLFIEIGRIRRELESKLKEARE